MLSSLSAADLRALRVFQTIYECGSFAAAERRLDVRQSTISAQLAGLEQRLGFRLCERGPGGFRLTERGRAMLEAHARLNLAIEDFTETAADLSRRAVGTLRLGLMDNTSTDPRFPTVELLRRFHERAPEVSLEIVQDIQSTLAEQVLDRTLDLAIGAFPADTRFDLAPLYVERHFIYCGPPHPLFDAAPVAISSRQLEAERWVRRSYELTPLEGQGPTIGRAAAVAANLEAVAVILRSLPVLGYLPEHFANAVAGGAELRRVTEDGALSHRISLLSRAGRRDTAAMKRFRTLATGFARQGG
ncbi:LysR family transcriptional regulator [Paracoccus marinaquae]|uniref:LysR family transcriptional regulator n=1 Tax=Paracoccus marinaquae TaxID=2841926 RepID=A0ABS6AE70_9RHOB|nr:LysR family transcriptional regulator [Paracoccus marinaquae]MBU3028895.1 LysR family transcriptional regulator [Paracoccus marinaquae]